MPPIAAQPIVRKSEEVGKAGSGDLVPKRAQLVETSFRRVAGDQGRVDGADGNSGDPVRLQVRLGQTLIDAGLESPQRAAALQEQGNALEGWSLQAAVALPKRLQERSVWLFRRPRRSCFDVGGSGVGFGGGRRAC